MSGRWTPREGSDRALAVDDLSQLALDMHWTWSHAAGNSHHQRHSQALVSFGRAADSMALEEELIQWDRKQFT